MNEAHEAKVEQELQEAIQAYRGEMQAQQVHQMEEVKEQPKTPAKRGRPPKSPGRKKSARRGSYMTRQTSSPTAKMG